MRRRADIRFLREKYINFVPHTFVYEEHGGTSPFSTRQPLPVYVEKSIFDLPSIYINGGKRGFLIEINPDDLRTTLEVVEVETAVIKSGG
ncbi:MAG: hypothetical protein HY966_02450 [Ignavibacteriales bacterium]|nr:hypothetical protein [Ignavibacteriales bacterium]